VIGGVLGSALTSTLLGESVPSFGALFQAVATDSARSRSWRRRT
jgi:hypothetical protein